MLRKLREPVTLFSIAVVGAGIGLALARLPAIAALGRWTEDLRIARLTPPEPGPPGIVVVALDEATLARLPYRSPVNRGFLADLIAELRAAGVRAIGLDVLIDQPTEAAPDGRLRAELARPGAPPVVAVWADPAVPLTPEQRAFHEAFLEAVAKGRGGLPADPFDGGVRRHHPAPRHPGEPPSLAGALARQAAGPGASPLPAGELPLAYRVGPDPAAPAFPVYPAHAVPDLPREWLAGRVALIGSVLPEVDRHRTPLSVGSGEPTPGVVIHAHALDQLLDGRRLPVPGRAATAGIALALAAIGVGLALLPLAWPARVLLGALVLGGLWVGAFALYAAGGWLVELTAPTAALFTAAAFGSARVGVRQRFIRRAFERYVAPAVVARLARSPENLRLGGERREITSLFTDLAGFTSLSEELPPERAVGLLNAYLDGLIRVALAHEGTVDKVIGDAIHVMFNAPEDQPDHACRAVACALGIDRFTQAFAAEQRAAGVPFGLTRIGVHTGWATVGNFGGAQYFDYTAHGDTVNTAARLEGANKYLGTRVCVSEAAATRCPDVRWRPVGDVVLAGKSTPVAVFEPVPEGVEPADLDAYGAAFARLRAGEPCARGAFEALAAKRPDDPIVALHLDRLRRGERGACIVLAGK